jgi:uncharacterized LabA/DUF88 family protein
MKVAIFFDGKNFYKDTATNTNKDTELVDIPKLVAWLFNEVCPNGGTMIGCHYFTGVEEGAAAETDAQKGLRAFLDRLEDYRGIFVHRFKRKPRTRACTNCNHVHAYSDEKVVDTAIVANMLKLAAINAFDVAVLVSGDLDHIPAVEGLRDLGKMVYVASWGYGQMSMQLRKAAFGHLDLHHGKGHFVKPKSASTAAVPIPQVVMPIIPATLPATLSTLPGVTSTVAAALSPSDLAGEETDFLIEVEAAKAFQNSIQGLVSLGWFINKWQWQKTGRSMSPPQKFAIKDRLEKQGRLKEVMVNERRTIETVATPAAVQA